MTDNLAGNTVGEMVEDLKKQAISKPLQITAIALALGFALEILFFDHAIGISFFILSALCGIGLLTAAILEGHKPPWRNAIFFVPILFFSAMVFIRAEPLTVFLDVVGTLLLFTLWVRDFRFQRFFDYGFVELGLSLLYVMIEACVKPWRVLGEVQGRIFKGKGRRSTLLGILRGLLLALPILIILLSLLTSADLIFGDRVREALNWLDMRRVVEYVARALLVILGTIFFLGAIVTALQDPEDRKIIGEEKPILRPFLGFVESVVVLGSVDLLFLIFLIVQFRYLFGGVANITAAGYTFSEYARRGFFELVAVGILSSGIIAGLSWWGKRESPGMRRWFNGLSAALVIQVGLILYSSLTRLLLYEEAYGFTRLRTYTHVFIPWMGLVLLVNLLLLLRNKVNRFPIPVVLGVVGFVASLNLLNVDAFIVRQNVARLEERYEIDLEFLLGLSEDAVPNLVSFAAGDLEAKEELLGELACWREQLDKKLDRQSWPSTHLSRSSAEDEFTQLGDSLDGYRISRQQYGLWMVKIDGQDRACAHQEIYFGD